MSHDLQDQVVVRNPKNKLVDELVFSWKDCERHTDHSMRVKNRTFQQG